jgi:fructosamine-3-kinase
MGPNTQLLSERIGDSIRKPFEIIKSVPLSGGCIHQARALYADNEAPLFLKYCPRSKISLLQTEANALEAIQNTRTVRVPRPILCEIVEENACLVLEFVEFEKPSAQNWQQLGKQLAQLHRTTASTFGWHEDNWIGNTPQINTNSADWITFFRDSRIAPQLNLAAQNGNPFRHGPELLQKIPDLLKNHDPQPALIHGDLWAGNVGFANNAPIIFDPAAHLADRECDLAMTRLFGGFPNAFYSAYQNEWPLPKDASARLPLYQLYHILNHANLFQGSYLQQAQYLIDELRHRPTQ